MQLASAVATYVLLGSAASLPVFHLTQRMRLSPFVALLIGWGIAPALVSYLLYVEFLVLPGLSRGTYIFATTAAFAIVTLIFRADALPLLRALCSRCRTLFHRVKAPRGRWMLIGVIAVIAAYVAFAAILFPIQGTDALRHSTIGRTLSRDLSLEHFPLRAPLADGTFTNVLYPPGLHLVYSWMRVASPEPESDAGVRTVSAFYFLLLLGLVWTWAEILREGTGVFAALLLACVPSLVTQSAGNSIDAMRLFFFCVPFFWLCALLRERQRGAWILLGILLLLSVTIHTTNLIALPVMGLCILIFDRSHTPLQRIGIACAVCGISALLGGVEYLRRLLMFGQLKGPSLYFRLSSEELVEAKGLVSLGARIWRGYLQIFDQPYQHGLVGVAFLLATPFRKLRMIQDESFARLVFIAGWLSLVLIWIAPSPVPGWANSRYALTVAPFAAVGGSLLLADLDARLQRKPWLAPLLATFAATGLLIGGSALTPTLIARTLSADGVLAAATAQRIETARWFAITAGAISGVLCAFILPRFLVPLATGAVAAAAGTIVVGMVLGVAHGGPTVAALVCSLVMLLFLARRMKLQRAPATDSEDNRLRMRLVRAAELPALVISFLIIIPVLVNPPLTKSIRPGNVFGLELVFASEVGKLEAIGSGTLDSVLYMNEETPRDAYALVSEDASFFYYGERPGIYWGDLRMADFYDASSKEAAVDVLARLGIGYIQLSNRSTISPLFAESHLKEIVADRALTQLVWDSGDHSSPARVYRLVGPAP